jgi:ribosome-binding ATPase YchF (GTP1/OBG family)
MSDCEKVDAGIQQGIPARRQELTAHELASVYECNLVSLKPVLYVANVKTIGGANKYVEAVQKIAAQEKAEVVIISGKDEADISQLAPEDRPEFLKELGLESSSMERLLNSANKILGLINFFTVGEDEVRSWTCKRGDKAPTAAGKIHKDLEKGFVRMEVIRYEDLIALGSEDAVAKAGKQRIEGKEYEVQDGDIVLVRFNKSK